MKTLITANEVNAARKAGQTSIRLPQDALITPQARDDAREYGIALVRDSEGRNSEDNGIPAVGTATPAASARQSPAPLTVAAMPAHARAENGNPSAPSTAKAASFIHRSAGITLAKRKELPLAPGGLTPASGALSLFEALVPAKGQPGAGYMCWENSSFAWTFDQAHILVVLEGELVLHFDNREITAEPGDTLRLDSGLSVTMVARGRVCCAYGSWCN